VLALIYEVELGQQVEAIGDDRPVAEVAIAVVEVRTRKNIRVLRLRTEAKVVAECVVPAQRKVRVSRRDVERFRRTGEHQQDGECRRAAPKRPTISGGH